MEQQLLFDENEKAGSEEPAIHCIISPDIVPRWFGDTRMRGRAPIRTMCIPRRDTIAGGYGIIFAGKKQIQERRAQYG